MFRDLNKTMFTLFRYFVMIRLNNAQRVLKVIAHIVSKEQSKVAKQLK